MYAMRAADHRRVFVPKGLFPHRLLKRRQLFEDQTGRLFKLNGQRRIQYIGGSQPKVHITGGIPDLFGDAGKKSDDVVFHFLFNRVDSSDIEAGIFFNRGERPGRYLPLIRQGFASVYFDIKPKRSKAGKIIHMVGVI